MGGEAVNVSFTVAMMLEAVNRMGPGVQSAMRQVQTFKQQLNTLNQEIDVTIRVKRIEETAKRYKDQAQNARSTAMEHGAEGAALLAPVIKTVTDFAKVEDSFTDLKIAAHDSSIPIFQMQEDLRKASIEAKRLGDLTRFTTREAYDGMTTLVKGGATLKDTYTGLGQAAIYLAQAGKVPIEQSAEAMVKISNAYQLTGEQMKDVADMINRVDGASTASIGSLQDGFKYSAGAASQLGQAVSETAQALAVLNNRGLDGSTAGTNYADMLQRLIPQTKQQRLYMESLGWLTESGRSVFFDATTGKIKKMQEVIDIMRMSLKDLRPDDQLKYLHKIFGEQGGRAAMAIMQSGKGSWEDVGENIAKAMPLEQRINQQMMNLMGRFENMTGSMSNLSAESGNPIGTFVSERLDGITEAINKTRAWSEANPAVVKGIMWILTTLGMLKMGTMVFYLLKALIFGLAGDAVGLAGWIGRIGIRFIGLRDAFVYFRSMGGGVFESLWKGAQWAFPWLGKISGWVNRFVIQWIIAAGRIGAGWLVAMGPVGWIILGVSAIIAAAVWAWNTNFMGFRDKCISVWNAISDWGRRIWDNITGWIRYAMDRAGGFIDRVREALGLSQRLSSYGPVRGVDLKPDGFGGNPPFVGGGNRSNTNNVVNNVHVNVPTRKDANEFVADLDLPGKYKDDGYNPRPGWAP
jgi:TP901 family phage tail tape measure protein